MEELIRVNTRAEKKAYKQLLLGLAVAGLTVEELKSFKEALNENRILKSENARLLEELKKQTKESKDKKDYISYLSQKEELK